MRAVAVCCALTLAGCAVETEAVHELTGVAFGTTWSVKFVGLDEDRPAVARAIDAVVDEVDREFSTYRSDSVISVFNAARRTDPIEVGPRVAEVVGRALAIAAATGGAFDPTIGPLTRLHPLSDRGVDEPPTEEEIARALASVGWRKLERVDERRLRKVDPGVEVDTNAFAKGWAVDRISEVLAEAGHGDHMVEVGGEVRCRGSKPGGVAWRIGIESPRGPGQFPEVVELVDVALATSGSYRQYFESGGVRVHHIVDPRTGRNAPGRAVSVSVRAAECAVADALATALMVTGPEVLDEVEGALGESFGALFLLRAEAGGIDRVEYAWR